MSFISQNKILDLCCCMAMCLPAIQVFSQCETTKDGNWNDVTVWGADCGGIRIPTSSDEVWIEPGHDIIITDGVNAVCDTLFFLKNGGSSPASITMNNTSTLTVNGDLFMYPITSNPGSNIKSKIVVNNNTLTVKGTLSMESKKIAGNNHEQEIETGATGVIIAEEDIELTANSGVKCVIDIDQGGTLKIGKAITMTGNGCNVVTNTGASGTVEYNAASDQQVYLSEGNPKIIYYNLTLAGSGKKSASGGDIKVNGTFKLAGTATFETGGAGENVDYGSSSDLEYAGTAAQTTGHEIDRSITDDTIVGLTINNINGVTLGVSITVTGTLDFLSGKLTLNNKNLIIGSGGSVTGADGDEYVAADSTGALRKIWIATGTFQYEIGSASEYSPYSITFKAPTAFEAGAYLGVRVVPEIHPNLNSPIDYVTRYWVNTPSGITTPKYDYTATYLPGDVYGETETNIFAGKWDGSAWEKHLAADADNDWLQGIDVESFSDVAGGDNASLPIKLIFFTASLNDNTKVKLSWATASETNNAYFNIEKSTNGLNFLNINEITGAGNSTTRKDYESFDENPKEGVAYYRLKQTDYDGKYEYSQLVAVSFEKKTGGTCVLRVLPNPCTARCQINLFDCKQNETVDIKIEMIDASGNKVYSNIPYRNTDGTFSFSIDTENNLKPGVYIVRGYNSEESYNKKMIVK